MRTASSQIRARLQYRIGTVFRQIVVNYILTMFWDEGSYVQMVLDPGFLPYGLRFPGAVVGTWDSHAGSGGRICNDGLAGW